MFPNLRPGEFENAQQIIQIGTLGLSRQPFGSESASISRTVHIFCLYLYLCYLCYLCTCVLSRPPSSTVRPSFASCARRRRRRPSSVPSFCRPPSSVARRRQATGDEGRPRETTEASSQSQISAPWHKPKSLTTPPGSLKLHLLGEMYTQFYRYKCIHV